MHQLYILKRFWFVSFFSFKGHVPEEAMWMKHSLESRSINNYLLEVKAWKLFQLQTTIEHLQRQTWKKLNQFSPDQRLHSPPWEWPIKIQNFLRLTTLLLQGKKDKKKTIKRRIVIVINKSYHVSVTNSRGGSVSNWFDWLKSKWLNFSCLSDFSPVRNDKTGLQDYFSLQV